MSTKYFEDFKKDWLKDLTQIKKDALDSDECNKIRLQFEYTALLINIEEDKFTSDMHVEMETLERKLSIALGKAHSRYKLRSHSIWARILESVSQIISNVARVLERIGMFNLG